MPTFSADQIINKTLIAKQPVQIKRLPLDSAPAVYTVAVGQPVGSVYSYLEPGPGQSLLYWMFYDSNNRPFYAEHKEGRFSIQSLTDQGAVTTEELTRQEKEKNETFAQKLEKYAKYILIGGAGIAVLSVVLKHKPWQSSRKRYA